MFFKGFLWNHEEKNSGEWHVLIQSLLVFFFNNVSFNYIEQVQKGQLNLKNYIIKQI